MDEAQRLLQDVAATLDALLRVRHGGDQDRELRERTIARYLQSEIAKRRSDAQSAKRQTAASIEQVLSLAAGLSIADTESIRCRCLFYGCDDLIALLVHKKVRADAIAREEAVLYVQDRLQRDDFRRIRTFDAGRGAAFVTYMWQVINNLLLDFLRAHGKRPEHVDGDAAFGASGTLEDGSVETPDVQVEVRDLHATLKELMTESTAGESTPPLSLRNPIREKLRQHLQLSSKEKVFLKAMFQYDMTINEIRELPGFAMGVNEAYRFHYRLMEQLIKSFKDAGVLDSLRAEVSDAAPRVSIQIEGATKTVEVTRIQYLEEEDRRTTRCLIRWSGRSSAAQIEEGFNKLLKRLAAFFTPVSAKEAVADRVLSNVRDWREEGILTITEIEKSFRIGKRQWTALKARFGPKSSP